MTDPIEVTADAAEPTWTSLRVGGDMKALTVMDGTLYRFDACRIDTPLPQGYPMPTPPGAIELKRYPVVRRAQVSSGLNPDLGMNLTFFPLFNHIKDREIAMTSPVEMDYRGMTRPDGTRGEGSRPDSFTMSFLYRTPDLGPTGKAGMVTVADQRAMTVVSIGAKGSYSVANVDKLLMALDAWLMEHPEWRRAGDPRALYYNGPDVATKNRWFEAQIPVESNEAGNP